MHIGTTLAELTEKIIQGDRIMRGDDLSIFLDAPLDELQKNAYILQKHFCGNHVDLCTIINGRSGRCGEDCKYCAQASCHHTGIEEYDLLPQNEIINNARANEKAGVNRFAIVTSGRALTGKDFSRALETYRKMKQTLNIELCASHGFLTAEQFHQLHEAGVTSYHHNIETSRRFFPSICTTHTYDDKIHTIKLAQDEGLCVCSGGIIGMGENWNDRLDMAVSLAELGIQSIPINALMPIKGTKLANLPRLADKDILRTIAFFRFINPEANIRLAAGRKLLPDNGETAFISGASASITGNMLTTSGTTIHDDLEILERLGLSNK
ncbi:biotin synthase BioB [Pectinatus frisingensis]|jgi:biotin synthase|uniref:biotin synthase BioB n=1 Tax=Pectinatus frisingensis TaxID=865 RepID=UPI0015F53C75|nr:biotin synthase BioB [Pectinatus frisingensis]